MSWENDEELTAESKFIRYAEGPNEFIFADDGTKVRSFGKLAVEFKTADGKTLSIRPGPILLEVSNAKKKLGTLVGRKLRFVRTGTTKEDTRYTNIEVL